MMKFDTYTNSNMLNSMMIFTFSVLDRKSQIHFLGKFDQKN